MRLKLSLLSLMMVFWSSLAMASDAQEAVSVHMDVYQIVMKKDVESRVLAKQAKPGDILEYVAVYQNNTSHDVSNLKGTLPIPEGMIYVAGSERPRHALASLDGVNYKPMPLMRRVKQADGTWKQVKVPLGEYRFLRWDLGVLNAEKSKQVSARMQVTPIN